ncbi:MAG: alpha/beta hydrolase [Clostridia bacterium]|nr:alpha/beta hydrolase [Clostridia bacterium]
MRSSQFYIMDDGIRLNARLDVPEGSDRLVIVIHGFTGHIEETHITAVSGTFNALGYATLRVDMYGHGHSDGAFRDHTLFKWMTNALTVIDYARGLDFVKEIYLCGHSQGGLLVMLAAAMRRELIRGLIPLSPAAMIPEICRRGEMLGIPFDPDNIPEELAFDDKTLGGNYLRVAQTIRVEDAIDRYDGPVLIVHGDDDESVPVRVGIDAAKRYKNGTVKLINGDDHCYHRHLDQVLDAVKAWMTAQFG